VNPDDYLLAQTFASQFAVRHKTVGGPELILAEILTCLPPRLFGTIWLPFHVGGILTTALTARGQYVVTGRPKPDQAGGRICAMYFGTPTIVGGKPLFPDEWRESLTKQEERDMVRVLCGIAEQNKAMRIVSGLGTGDIDAAERMHDMGGGRVVCEKQFDTFTDWVLVRDIPPR